MAMRVAGKEKGVGGKAMALATRVAGGWMGAAEAGKEEGNGKGGKSDGDGKKEGDGKQG